MSDPCPHRLASPWLGLLAGALCALALACSSAGRKSMAPPPKAIEGAGMPPPAPGARGELDQLSRQIDADLAAMSLERPPVPTAACILPPCEVDALSTAPPSLHTDDPSCRPGPAEVCRDSCKLSNSICQSSGRICKIAIELGGNDAYANEKCASGKASCESARTKCCGCQ